MCSRCVIPLSLLCNKMSGFFFFFFLHRHTHPLSFSGSRLVGKSSISLPNTARAVKWGKGWKREKKKEKKKEGRGMEINE